MQFKLYKDGDGTLANDAGGTGGTLLWTENWLGVNSQAVTVKNGYFSVNLGSITSLTGIDFNQSVMWLSQTVASGANATSSSCATFAACNSNSEGEMLPMRRLASAVYALQANSCTTCILQAPTSTTQNTISPTTNSVTALTVNGTSGTAATALSVAQTGNATNLAVTNTGATNSSLLTVTQSTSAYTGTAILVNMAAGSGSFASGNFIDLQANSSSKFKVDFSGVATAATSVQTPLVDTASAAALSIGTGNANAINIGKTSSNITTTVTGLTVIKPSTGNDSASAFQIQNASGSAIVNTNSILGKLTVSQGALAVNGLSNPSTPTLALTSTGGSLANATTYTYLLAATGIAGETQAIPTNPTSTTTANGTSLNTITWSAVTNATGYNLYRSTDGGTTWFVNSVGNVTSAVDNGTNFTWTTSPGAGFPAQFSNDTGDIFMTAGASVVLDSGGNGTLKYNAVTKTLSLANSNAAGSLNLQSNAYNIRDNTGFNEFQIASAGATTFKNRTNSAAAFQVLSSGGATILGVDTSGSVVSIAGTLDTATGTALSIGTTNATSISLKQNVSVASGKTLTVPGHSAFGSGATASANNTITLDDTIIPTGNSDGISSILRVAPTAADANYHTGAFIEVQTPTGNAQNLTGGFRGASLFAQHNGTGTLAQAWGGEFRVDNTSTGTITEAVALQVQSATNSGGGSIGTNYGLRVSDQTVGGTNYAIYTGQGTVRLGGNVTLNGTTLSGGTTYTATTALQAPLLDTATAAALSIGTTNATAINLGKTGSNITTTINGLAVVKPTPGNDSTTAFQVQNSNGEPLLTVDTTTTNILKNSGFEAGTTNWAAKGTTSTFATDSTAANVYHGVSSLKSVVTAATSGAATSGGQAAFTTNILASTQYQLTFFAKCDSTYATLTYGRQDVAGTDVNSSTTGNCTTSWQQFTAHWTTGATITNPNIYVNLGATTAGTLWIDGVSLVQTNTSAATNYAIGKNLDGGIFTNPTIFQNGANSPTAFQIQNAAATTIFGVNTSAQTVNATGGANFLLTDANNFTITAPDTTTDPNVLINLQCTTCSASGGRFAVQNTGTDLFLVNPDNTVRVGDATNNVTFAATTHEPTLNGSARHTRQITLSPEYAGATMTASGINNVGKMTSDNMTSTPYKNYYQWANTQTAAQNYDIWVRVPLPSDFSALPSGQTICLDTYASATTAGGVLLNALYDTSNAAVTVTTNDLTPTVATTWQNKCTSSITGGTYAANGVMTIDLKLTAPATTGIIRIGDLTFSYLSKW